jgi:hypothetical protein
MTNISELLIDVAAKGTVVLILAAFLALLTRRAAVEQLGR